MQYVLLFNNNNGSALAPQCNVTAASDLSKADLRLARFLRVNSACSSFVIRSLAAAPFRADLIKPKTARYPSSLLQSVAGCGFDFTKIDTTNSPLHSSSTLLFFIREGVLMKTHRLHHCGFQQNLSQHRISPHPITMQKWATYFIRCSRYLDISLLSTAQTSSAASPASNIIQYRNSFRGVKQPGRQVNPSLSPTRLQGVDREHFTSYREPNGIYGHKLTALRSTERS